MGVVVGAIASSVILLVAYCGLAILEGRLQGRERPNLEVGMAVVFAVLGGVLFPFWRWTSTVGLLAVFVVWTLVGAWLDRRRTAPASETSRRLEAEAGDDATLRTAEPAMPSGPSIDSETALELLGSLASMKVQRRHIVAGTVDAYLLPAQLA